MDAFSRTLLGTTGYFMNRGDLPEDAKKDIIRFVGSTRWLVGMVGTADGLDLSEKVFLGAAMDLARRLGGRLFTGTELLAPPS